MNLWDFSHYFYGINGRFCSADSPFAASIFYLSCCLVSGGCQLAVKSATMHIKSWKQKPLRVNATVDQFLASCLLPFFSALIPFPSEEKQEADQDESATSLWIIGAHPKHACSSHPTVHAPTRAHHAVCAQGHWAWDHLLRLWQHPARHLLQAHDHSQQAGRTAGHLCSQVGQVPARYGKVFQKCVSFGLIWVSATAQKSVTISNSSLLNHKASMGVLQGKTSSVPRPSIPTRSNHA